MYGEKKRKYNENYTKENYRTTLLRMRRDFYENEFLKAVEESGESVNSYIINALKMRMRAEGAVARKWYLIEDCSTSRSQVFHTELKATNKKDAIREAVEIWNALSDYDKEQRESVYIFRSTPNEYGDPDFDKSTDAIAIKEASR